MSDPDPAARSGAAIGLDHVGIVGADLDRLAESFAELGFHVTPFAAHESGRTGNRCVMLRDGGYLELIAKLPGQSSATLDRFLATGPGAHILALEIADEVAALARLHRACVQTGEPTVTERNSGLTNAKSRFAVIMPPDQPEGRVLLVRQFTRELLWRPDNIAHPNRAVALTEAVYATDTPTEIMTRLSRLTGRPAEPDPLGGYRVTFAKGCVRVLPRAVASALFPGTAGGPPLIGLTVAIEGAGGPVVHAAGVAIRFAAVSS
jgi:Glyoxalase-like domain